MARRKSGFTPANDFAEGSGFFDRLNRRLFPLLGPPPLGPYDQPEQTPVAVRACPLCGAAMADHTRGVTEGRTILYCPGADSTASADSTGASSG